MLKLNKTYSLGWYNRLHYFGAISMGLYLTLTMATVLILHANRFSASGLALLIVGLLLLVYGVWRFMDVKKCYLKVENNFCKFYLNKQQGRVSFSLEECDKFIVDRKKIIFCKKDRSKIELFAKDIPTNNERSELVDFFKLLAIELKIRIEDSSV